MLMADGRISFAKARTRVSEIKPKSLRYRKPPRPPKLRLVRTPAPQPDFSALEAELAARLESDDDFRLRATRALARMIATQAVAKRLIASGV